MPRREPRRRGWPRVKRIRGCPPRAVRAMREAYSIVVEAAIQAWFAENLVQDAAAPKRLPKRVYALVDDATRTIQRSADADLEKVERVLGAKAAGGQRQLNAFRRRNIALIKTAAGDTLDALDKTLRKHGNLHRDALTEKILEVADVSRGRAKFWAVDQTLKLNAAVTQAKHESLGIRRYEWRTSRDGSVRDTHAALEGKAFAYADPPETGTGKHNPGEDYRCRCHADPILEDVPKSRKPRETRAERVARLQAELDRRTKQQAIEERLAQLQAEERARQAGLLSERQRAIPASIDVQRRLAGFRRLAPFDTAALERQRAALRDLPRTLDAEHAAELVRVTGARVPVQLAERHPRLVAALGRDLEVTEWTHPRVQEAVAEFDKLAPELLHTVAYKRGLRFGGVYIGARGGIPELDDLAHLRGIRPRSWSQGSTWDTVGGAFSVSRQVVAVDVRGNSGSASTVAHEFGHAVGERLGLHDHPELIDWHRRLHYKLEPYEAQGGPGAAAGRQEFLAESIARLHVAARVSRGSGLLQTGAGGRFVFGERAYREGDLLFDHVYSAEYRAWLTSHLQRLQMSSY